MQLNSESDISIGSDYFQIFSFVTFSDFRWTATLSIAPVQSLRSIASWENTCDKQDCASPTRKRTRFIRLRRGRKNPSSVYYILILTIAREGEFSLARQTRSLPFFRTIAKSILWHEGQPSSYNLYRFRFKSRYACSASFSLAYLSVHYMSLFTVWCTYISISIKMVSAATMAASIYKTAVSSLRDFSWMWAWSRSAAPSMVVNNFQLAHKRWSV